MMAHAPTAWREPSDWGDRREGSHDRAERRGRGTRSRPRVGRSSTTRGCGRTASITTPSHGPANCRWSGRRLPPLTATGERHLDLGTGRQLAQRVLGQPAAPAASGLPARLAAASPPTPACCRASSASGGDVV